MKTFQEWLNQKNEAIDLKDLRTAARTAKPLSSSAETNQEDGAAGGGGKQSGSAKTSKKKPIKPEVGSEETTPQGEIDLNQFKGLIK